MNLLGNLLSGLFDQEKSRAEAEAWHQQCEAERHARDARSSANVTISDGGGYSMNDDPNTGNPDYGLCMGADQ